MYGITLQDTNKLSKWLNSCLKVVEKLKQDVVLGFNWLQSVNPWVYWFSYSVILKNGFFAAGIPVSSCLTLNKSH